MKTAIILFAFMATAFAASKYQDEFTTQYKKLKNKANGYLSPEGIPYHSIETLMVEAPDHGHQTTSEAYSYLIWLEAMNGHFTKDYAGFNDAWDVMEKYIIPTKKRSADK